MANFARKQVKIAVIVAPKAFVGAICLSLVASQISAQPIRSIASSPQSGEASGCNASAMTGFINRLSQPNSPSAFTSLVQCGELAVQPLISVLNDRQQDALTRRLAARALGQIGSREAIAALLSIAQQRQSKIRDSALRAIADINPQAREAVPVLITAVISRDIEVLTAGTKALQRIDPAVPVQVITSFWEAALSPKPHRLRTTNTLLDQFRASQLNLADLTRVLRDEDSMLRAIAAYLLLQQGRSAETMIPQLTRALTDESSLVRDTAACALGRIGTREAITVLITQLKTGNEASQTSAAIGLSSLTAEAREALPVLIAALRDDNERVRSVAAYALGQVGRDARQAIPALLNNLSDHSISVRALTAHALGQIAPDDPIVIRLLVRQAASDAHRTVRYSAIQSLGQITSKGVPTLLEMFASQNHREAEVSARTLLYLGPIVDSYLTPENLPKILQGLSHTPWRNSRRTSYRITFVNYALQQLGDVAPTLISWLDSPNEDIRVGATLALWIGNLEGYFDRQSIELATPSLAQTFRNSQLYALWQSKNQALVEAASRGNLSARSQVEWVFGDRSSLSAFAVLSWLRGPFWEDVSRENRMASKVVHDLVKPPLILTREELEEALGRRPLLGEVPAAAVEQLVAEAEGYLSKNRPAICRLPIAKFLWRCR